MKTTIRVSKDFIIRKNIGVEIGIVTGKLAGSHTHEYQIFPLEKSIPEIGIIGVKDETFSISFLPNFSDRFGFSVYLDGINVSQKTGINSLNEIAEHLRSDYSVHHGGFIYEDKLQRICYLDRYSQKNGENRTFTFTSAKKSGINEVLIQDPSLTNRIEIYIWKEANDEDDHNASDFDYFPFSDDLSPLQIGAGEVTGKSFGTTHSLNNPTYIGKATFIYQPAAKMEHLGKVLIPAKINDPMDRVPKS